MSQRIFEERYSAQWHQLEGVLGSDKSSGNDGHSTALPELYRTACHQLALAKHRRYSTYLVAELNQLVLRGHHRLYQNGPRHSRQWVRFIVRDFPQTLRRNAVYLWLAGALFFVPGLLMGLGCYFNEDLIYSILSPDAVNNFDQMYDADSRKLGRETESDTDWVMFGYYIRNNIGIAFRTFAGGILFGIGSIFFLVYNGLVIGGVAGHVSQIGYAHTFFPFVIGHGAFELTAIALSGAAGLKLGYALVDPGPYRRGFALREAARDAVQIVYGATLMLIVAAFVEAFWSSSSAMPIAVKYSVGAFLWIFVVVYVLYSGRSASRGP